MMTKVILMMIEPVYTTLPYLLLMLLSLLFIAADLLLLFTPHAFLY